MATNTPITHHLLLARAGRGDLDACAAPVRELPTYFEPVCRGRLAPVCVVVCDECDVVVETWCPRGPVLEMKGCYPYRTNIRVGKRRRKGH